MGKNTPDRQQFIIENLKVELDLLNDDSDEWYKWEYKFRRFKLPN
jgi:hypothetical protein